jgi:hypothetical protein
MHSYNTKTKMPLNNEQTPKQWRTRKKMTLMGEGGEKKEVKKVGMGDVLSIQEGI